ncbi:T9SS type A sorting domain-containing protein [Echinicola soli]|uniref:T9SS type A sorting domain-containing protein n=1 Tax=Echinicola soli TaxID=2591634 RepID=A0A514CFW6_9BACT|nr:T9SS type A sorting domain-containing protein [Echinicola soli]QDH78709.1 T9SS type A sorting domain-containing protein [Echinicola soli]
MMKFYFALLVLLLLLPFYSKGQIKTEKVDKSEIPRIPAGIATKSYSPIAINIEEKETKLQKLEESILEYKSGEGMTFGIFEEFFLNFDKVESSCLDGTCYKEVSIYSKGANTLGFYFDQILLGPNSEFYIINDEESFLQGPFTKETVNKTEGFISGLIPGERLRLLLKAPENEVSTNRIVISEASYGIYDFFGVNKYTSNNSIQSACFGCSASCNQNIKCFSTYEEESHGVMLMLVKSGGTYSTIGTGALLNNGKQDYEPIVLTAVHVSPTIYLDSMQFMFHYRSPQCNPTSNGPTNIIVQGASPLGPSDGTTDLRLLKLDVNPHNSPVFNNNPVSYLGWSINSNPIGSVVGIHHPVSDVQKFLAGDVPSLRNDTSGPGNYYYWEFNLTNGLLQPVSSGSPLLDDNKRVIGANHGRDPGDNYDCNYSNNPKVLYGRLNRSWDIFSQYLDPNNEGLVALNTITNQPGAETKGYIEGLDYLCSSTNYELKNSPLEFSINWTVSPAGLVTNSSGTGPIANLSPSSPSASGDAVLTFTITSTGGSVQTEVNKTIKVGKPGVSSIWSATSSTGLNLPVPFVATYPDRCDEILDAEWDVYPTTVTIMEESGFPCAYPNNTGVQISFHNSGSYSVRVRVKNGCGWGGWSNPTYIQANNFLAFDYTVYPNPASNEINIEIQDGPEKSTSSPDLIKQSPFEVNIFDELGNLMLSTEMSDTKFKLDVSALTEGYYFMHIKHDKGVIRKKIKIER